MEKHYDYSASQKALAELWQAENIYAYTPEKPVYSIDTPPPTVSGSLHIGHIFSYTQTDVIARYHRMKGASVFYPFGFDDNGLPTERFVEKRCGVSAHAIGRSAFIALCLKETAVVEDEFKRLWQTIGLSVDWKLCYSTIDVTSRRISQQSFLELLKKGYAYRKNEPALFCTTCRTSVAQAELDDVEKQTLFSDIAFAGPTGQLIIATTRPELLPACVALLFHPDDARYKNLAGKMARVPLFGHEVPIISDHRVKPDKGTGLVMCCTFGDTTDIEWFTDHQLPYRQIMGMDGVLLPLAGPLAGLKVAAARERVLELLKEAGVLGNQKTITHAVNVHERCKKEIEYLMIPQWFLSIVPHKEKLLALADEIAWHPTFMKNRYIDWVSNISWDWCLSRQRYFGIPFPIWHCTSCNEILCASPEQLPVDPQETGYPGGVCPHCESNAIVPDTDVMDTWNTSSLTPYLCKELAGNNEQFIPMSMRPQAHDIIRTWAFYTIVKAWMHENKIPWNDIVISGHVLAGEGGKISKSQGNSPLQPENLLATYPADVIRYWTSTGGLGHDIAFSETQLKIGNKLLVKLWNAFKFIGEHARHECVASPRHPLNRWILHRLSQAAQRYHSTFKTYEFAPALDAMERFFWADLCDNYLELIKDQLFNPDRYDAQLIEETRSVLTEIGHAVLAYFAPYIPYITDELYQRLYRPHTKIVSIHNVEYASFERNYSATDAVEAIELLLQIVAEVRRLKTDKQLSLKTELVSLTIDLRSHDRGMIQPLEVIIKGVAKVPSVLYAPADIAGISGDEGAYHCTVVVS